MVDASTNPLISTKPSDSNLAASIHPLVLLTVADQITRHQVRHQEGPIVGALLGQQRGREITAEYAFPCKVIEDTAGQWLLDQEWMETRIQQFRDVHKAPWGSALEVTGLYTICPESGPTPALVPLQKQAITLYNDSSILLTFHPAAVSFTARANLNGRLPLSVYEGVLETEPVKEDSSMQVDGDDASTLLFRSIPYTVDTDETEMIAIDYVAKGAGSATAVGASDAASSAVEPTEKKGKKKADTTENAPVSNGTKDPTSTLTTEEEDQIAGLTMRLNSVKMLQSRLALLSKFLQSQPPSYLSDSSTPLGESSPVPTHLPHLRNIQALITRLSLLTPAVDSGAQANQLLAASQAQSNDVALSSLLSLLGQDIQSMSEMGRKFAQIDASKASKGKGKHGAYDTFGDTGSHDSRVGGWSMGPGGMLI